MGANISHYLLGEIFDFRKNGGHFLRRKRAGAEMLTRGVKLVAGVVEEESGPCAIGAGERKRAGQAVSATKIGFSLRAKG